MRIKIFILISVISGLNILAPPEVLSCPIPVYRYALEYWDADPYSIEIFYKNSLDPREEELVNYLIRASRDSERKANLELRNLNTEGNIDEITRGFLNKIAPPEFPWVVLRYPRIIGLNEIIWSGPLNKESINLILTSPVRESMADKLVKDATAVWVLLESGDRQKDRAAYDLLNRELRRLEQTLVLPDLELWWNSSQDDSDDNKPNIKFDIVRVSRDDPREEYLVKMLLNSEADLNKFESEPIVFPVYGRGIALWAIVGKGINEWNIREAAEFLTGPCSCQAKLLNPGVDILISMNWDKFIIPLTDMSIANPLSGIGDFSSREVEVRRLLESATSERLGTDITSSGSRANEAGRVVYLDIFKDNAEEISDKGAEVDMVPEDEKKSDTEKIAEETIRERENEMVRDELADPLLSEQIDSNSAYEQYQTKANFTNILIAVFSGVIVLVLLGSIVLYKKNIK